MANYAIFEDATSTTYGATGPRPIAYEVDTESPSQLALNTPAGFTSLVLTGTQSLTTHYIAWSGSAWQAIIRAPIHDGTNWDAFIDPVLNGSPYAGSVFINGDSTAPNSSITIPFAWTANGSSTFGFGNMYVGARITMTTTPVLSYDPGQYLVQNGDTFIQSAPGFDSMYFTTTLGDWRPGGGLAQTPYVFYVDDPLYMPTYIQVTAD